MDGVVVETRQPVELGSGQAAQRRLRPGGEDRDPTSLREGQRASVEHDDRPPDKTPSTSADVCVNGVAGDTEVEQLRPRHDVVLQPSEIRQRGGRRPLV